MHECKECGHQWPRSTVVSINQDGKYATGRECPKCVAFVPSPPRGNVCKRRIEELERKLAVAVEALEFIASQNLPGNWAVKRASVALEEIEK